jgi:hypothetical protein
MRYIMVRRPTGLAANHLLWGLWPMVPDEPSQVAFSFVFDPESQHAEKKRYSIVHECSFSCAMA